jgi:hypothetical protein
MTDESKQEQQRKLMDLMDEGFNARRSRYISRDERQALERLEARARCRQEELKDMLCGPYGRFFNEGTD